MKIGIVGSGTVAQTLGTRLAERGQSVMISSRDTSRGKDLGERGALPSADEWVAVQRAAGRDAAAGSFDAAAVFGELAIVATPGLNALDALATVERAALAGKIVVDLSNPLDFSHGMPPILGVCNTESIGERVQAAFPEARVVKTLNTVNVNVMIDPGALGEDTHLFVAGNDAEAKRWVTDRLLKGLLGWKLVLDVGDITAARGLEMYLPLWLRMLGATGTSMLNVKVVTAAT
jgi:hypothetical protein